MADFYDGELLAFYERCRSMVGADGNDCEVVAGALEAALGLGFDGRGHVKLTRTGAVIEWLIKVRSLVMGPSFYAWAGWMGFGVRIGPMYLALIRRRPLYSARAAGRWIGRFHVSRSGLELRVHAP